MDILQSQQQLNADDDGDVSPQEDSPVASSTDRWASSYSYSRVLSSSMKKIMNTRPRMMAMKATVLGGYATDEPKPASDNATNNRKQELELFSQFAAAVSRKDKEAMLTVLTQHPQLTRIQNEEDQLPLHLVCALVPNYFYADLIDMMVQANEESPASMDKAGQTPLHVICQNATVTSQTLTLLLAAMPAAVVMCDKRCNLAVHYLCSNPKCDLEMLWRLGQPDTYAMKNEDARTPLHCLVKESGQLKQDIFQHLLQACPSAAAGFDADGRSVLHWFCESEELDLELLAAVLPLSANAPCKPDKHGDVPLHLVCQNSSVTVEILKRLLQANPEAVSATTENDLSALHFLCANDGVSGDLLTAFLAYDKLNQTASLADLFGATPLHILCMNEAITAAALRVLLLVSSGESFAQDVHGRSPMHYLCMNPSIASDLVWLFLERTPDLVREIDSDGKTPLHYLCANKSVAAVTLEILYDACPSAAMVADKELRLPIQYLADNASSPPETTALLISGPASYRLRYDFLSVVGTSNTSSFLQNYELVYVQTNLAVDSKGSNSKVWIKFFSTAAALDHECAIVTRLNTLAQRLAAKAPQDDQEPKDFALKLYEDFDDAKRRVSVRRASASAIAPEDHIADTSVTLHHGLVTEAPAYTLEALYNEQLEDLASVRAVIAEVGECLAFWHREALMVHGNVALECVGQFAPRGLRLVHFHTSREFHEHLKLDVQAFKATSVPPEAARVFLTGESFEPTTASDIWQFGCLIFHLATGKSLLSALAPWSSSLDQTRLLHFISALTDDVIHQAISSVHESLQSLLQVMLLTNPAQRWTIDRVMHIDAFRSASDTGASCSVATETVRARLQRHADCELLNAEYQRSAKHAQDQLEFIKHEQKLLRAQFLATKTELRESEEAIDQLRNEATTLRQQLDKIQTQKREAQQELRVFARNHQSMTHQLHTTMQLLLNLVPLAQKVYGTSSDEFLSGILAQSTGSESASLSTIDIGSGVGRLGVEADPHSARPGRRKSAVDMVKSQLQNSILAHGCINTWANSSPPPVVVLEPHELSASSRSEEEPDEDTKEFEGHDLEEEKSPAIGLTDIDLDAEEDNQQQHELMVEGGQSTPSSGCFLVEADDTDEECF